MKSIPDCVLDWRMEAKAHQPRGVFGGKAECVCEVGIQSHENPVLPDCELKYYLVTRSRKAGLNHGERIISFGA